MSAVRVVHVIDRLGVGGAESLLLQAAREAAVHGWKLSVVSLGDAPQSAIPAKLSALGVRVNQLPSGNRRTLLDVGRLRRLRRILRASRADVVHTHLAYANTLTPIALIGTGIPVVSTLHNTSGGVRSGQSARDRLEALVLRHLVAVRVAVGPSVQAAQLARLRRPVRVISNPAPAPAIVDVGAIEAARVELLGTAEGPLLLAVGRLTEQKGFDDLIRAFALIHERRPESVLAIVGRGHLREALEKQIGRLGLTGSVRLAGVRNDVPALMLAADLVVSSSRWEGLPLALLEAMSVGRAIVATDVGDVGYAVGEAASLVTPGDPEAFAQAVDQLAGDEDERRRRERAATQDAQGRLSLRRWSAALDATYLGLVGNRPSSLVVLTHGYAPRVGGIERQRAQVTPRLAASGLDTTVVTRAARHAPRRELRDGVRIVRTVSVGGKAPGSATTRKIIWKLARPFDSAAYSLGALIAVLRRRPDIIHTHEFISTARVGLLAGRILRRPVIVMSHRSGVLGDVGRNRHTARGQKLLARIGTQAALAIAVSAEADEELADIGIEDQRRLIVHNGVDTEKFRPVTATDKAKLRSDHGLATDAVVVVFTGRLMPEKRVGTLLSVWPQVRRREQRAELVIVGTGDDEARLRAAATDGVRFVGAVADTVEYLQAADVFVLPSVAEGLSNALLEAQACGLAAIVTDVGAAREVVEDQETGLIIAPGDERALLDALTNLVTSAEHRETLGANARKRVCAEYSIDATVDQLLAAYSRIWISGR